jgi:hypothetical protein
VARPADRKMRCVYLVLLDCGNRGDAMIRKKRSGQGETDGHIDYGGANDCSKVRSGMEA